MISVGADAKLKRSLIKHEGRKNFPYVDTLGNVTWGIGYNASQRGIKDFLIDEQYEEDVHFSYRELSQFGWFKKLNEDRKIVLIDMSFMGMKKLLNFKGMISAIERDDFKTAAMEMLDSEWAKEVKERALDLAQGMSTGVYLI